MAAACADNTDSRASAAAPTSASAAVSRFAMYSRKSAYMARALADSSAAWRFTSCVV